MKLISVNIPSSYLEVLELLVADGKFPNRSEAIRVSIRDLIKTEYLIDEKIQKTYDTHDEPEINFQTEDNMVI
ncbi:MAG: ribbon-helix-helix protein, CopG family [Candidatus Lokiarchaeota archaeon]|nr:ribbon-helix-helix protein, CopG family [Candidatus Lokiarchaeota archaeon]MBD3201088.1 ribbon-helix-helix protein, CopG family [Candidatus Lokiarchaeota archaeon]